MDLINNGQSTLFKKKNQWSVNLKLIQVEIVRLICDLCKPRRFAEVEQQSVDVVCEGWYLEAL